MNPVQQLAEHGQSIWLDSISRSLIITGALARQIEGDGLRGMTSNPAIFEKAIGGSKDYDASVAALVDERDRDAMALYEAVAIRDIQDAADVFRPVYEKTGKKDGYVSLEVSPYLARDTQATIVEARRLWRAVHRPNIMIKIPGTPEGVPAIEQAIFEGINVNVTLLFARSAYEAVAEAYIRGLERRAAEGKEVAGIASVASFFVSRIDSSVDAIVAKRLEKADAATRARLESVLGKVAVANAKLAYETYETRLTAGPRWKALAARGAMPQRLLWASTGTKNKRYSDVLYVDELIGPDTVNTAPPQTIDAFRDHGKVAPTLRADLDGARATLETLASLDISLDDITRQLTDQAVDLFADAFDTLLAAAERKRKALLGKAGPNPMSWSLSKEQESALKATLEEWRAKGKARRLWAKDASLWTGKDESKWLGWLDIVAREQRDIGHFRLAAEEARANGFADVVVLGMGGSSLCPEVMSRTFTGHAGSPRLSILDSTDPAQVRALEAKLDLSRTLFVVSSKSGSTLEPNIFKAYFFEKVKEKVGPLEAPRRFIAITDPSSPFEAVAKRDGFRRIFHGLPSIGGRYSALSDFGMMPSALAGIDVARFLERTATLVRSCAPSVPAPENPGVQLGAILGNLAREGRDKLTVVAPPRVRGLGAWLEQLVAESTGKDGKGIIPVDLEEIGPPSVYGADRVFVYARLETAPDAAQDAAVAALEKAGQPVVRVAVAEPYALGQEFFRFEVATAVAGAVIGLNPFDQPDVEASKVETKKLTAEFEAKGSLPPEMPFFEGEGVKLFADEANKAALTAAAGGDRSLKGFLRAHLGRLKAGDYAALLAYVEMSAANEAALQAARHAVRDAKRVATCLGFGPRFLHSTGQAYKGGPNSGVFLQVTADDAQDLPVPGAKYGFGVVKAAQARGDFAVLAARGRRALRVHLGADVAAGLAALGKAVAAAVAG
jgi:transaldolase/glucose-6-phosphate isomerase